MAEGTYITSDDLQLGKTVEDTPLNLKEVREDAERRAIQRALNHYKNNISETANALGITRPTLYSLIEKLGLKS